jgi:hypothetical protein
VPIYIKPCLILFSVFAGTFIELTNIKPHEHFRMPRVVCFYDGYPWIIREKKKLSNKLHAGQQAQPLASGALALEH